MTTIRAILDRRVWAGVIVSLVAAAAAGVCAASVRAALRPVDPTSFRLRDTGTWADKSVIVDELARAMPAVTVGEVVRDGNRRVEPLGRSPALQGVAGIVAGFRWQQGDDETREWYPQGVTGSAEASANGRWDGERILLASWYSKARKGVRVTFVLANRLSRATYRHVLLVDPVRGAGGVPDYVPVTVHAGGIAWYGPYLYVADTYRGLRVFDVRRILAATSSEDAIGRDARGHYRAYGYKYVLPQLGAYAQLPGTGLRFSFASVDRTSSPNSLITGEYNARRPGGRILRWPLEAASARLAAGAGGVVQATQALVSSQPDMQGALSVGRQLFLSSSSGARTHVLGVAGQDGRIVSRPWAVGAEDLAYSAATSRIYSLTEIAGRRVVFAINRPR